MNIPADAIYQLDQDRFLVYALSSLHLRYVARDHGTCYHHGRPSQLRSEGSDTGPSLSLVHRHPTRWAMPQYSDLERRNREEFCLKGEVVLKGTAHTSAQSSKY